MSGQGGPRGERRTARPAGAGLGASGHPKRAHARELPRLAEAAPRPGPAEGPGPEPEPSAAGAARAPLGTGSPRGRFITFEGIDGAGKTTHIERLAQALRDRGREVLVTREPGGTPLAEALRELVLHRPMDPLTEALLVFAARRDHLRSCIEPALAAGVTVVCDRFTDASFAYQGGGRGCAWEQLETLERWVHPALQPDLTLWFDLPAEEAARRRSAARAADRFESEQAAFFERVRAGYALRREAAPLRFALIDARLSPEAVWRRVEAAAREHELW